MKTRLNVKLLLGLIALVAIPSLLLTAYWYRSVRNNPAKYIAQGDAMAAAGDFAGAANQYSAALRRRGNDLELLLKYSEAIGNTPVDDARQAEANLKQINAVHLRMLEINPNDEKALSLALGWHGLVGRKLLRSAAWEQMLRQAETALRISPDNPTARRFRGVAVVNRMATLDVTESQREQAREDLTPAAQSGNDTLAALSLASWHLLTARQLDRPGAGGAGQAALERKAARQIINANFKAASTPDEFTFEWIRLLQDLGDHKAADQATASVEQALLASPESEELIAQAADALVRAEAIASGATSAAATRASATALDRAEALLSTGLKASPQSLRLRAMLGKVLSYRDDSAQAMAMFKEVAERKPRGDWLSVLQDANLGLIAAASYTDLALGAAERQPVPALREEYLATAQAMNDRLREMAGPSAMVLLQSGRIALLRNRPDQAQVDIDKASAMLNDAAPEALLYSARASMASGQNGVAIKRLQRLIEIRPDYLPGRYELARLQLRANHAQDAQKTIDALLAGAPADRTGLTLRALHLAQTGENDKAIRALEAPELRDHRDAALALASLYVTTRQPAKARALLEKMLKKNPRDLPVLQQLIRLSPDKQAALAYVEQARQGGAGATELSILEILVRDPSKIGETMEGLIAEGKDPFAQAMARLELYRQQGKTKEAAAALTEAARLNPDHAVVVEAQFEDAIGQRDWATAESLAARAAKAGLDQAQGAFYYARLHLARGNVEQAIGFLKRGLEARPVYADGWSLRGQAALRAGDPAGAASAFERAIEQKPDHIDAMRGLAAVQLAQGRADVALDTLRRAVAFAPGHRALMAQYLAVEQQFGDKERVLQFRQRMARSSPDDLHNRRLMAILLAQMGRHEDAMSTIDAVRREESTRAASAPATRPALGAAPGVGVAGRVIDTLAAAALIRQMAGKGDEGLAILSEYITSRGEQADCDDYMTLGQYLYVLGRVDPAIEAYQRAARIEDPTLRPATRQLADLYFDHHMANRAVALYQNLHNSAPDDIAVSQRLVEALVRNNELDRARKAADDLVKQKPNDAGVQMMVGVVARARGDADAALAAFSKAIELDPGRALAYLERAELFQQQPDKEAAVIADLQRAVDLAPGLAQARRRLAQAYVLRGEPQQAIAQYKSILQQNPAETGARIELGTLYLDGKQTSELTRLMEEGGKLSPNDANWLRFRARVAVMENKPEAAAKLMAEAFRQAPGPQSLAEMIAAHLDAGQADQAMEALASQPTMVAESPVLLAMRGRAQTKLGKAEAQATFEEAIGKCRNTPQIAAVIGQLSAAVGREGAIEALLKNTALGIGGWRIAAAAQLMTAMGRGKEAVELLRRAEPTVAKSGEERVAFDRVLGLALHQTRDLDGAQAAYRRVLATAADDRSTLNNLAFLLTDDLNKPVEALPLAQRAAQLAPRDAQVLDTLGWVQFKLSKLDAAEETLRRSIQCQGLAVNCYHLALVLAAQGRSTEADPLLKRALRLAQDTKDAAMVTAIEKAMGK